MSKKNELFVPERLIPGDFFEDLGTDLWFPRMRRRLIKGNIMKVDIKEDDKTYTVEAELPGADKKDIKVDYDNKTLTISYEKSEESKVEKENYIRQERQFESTERSFYIENIDEAGIKAKFENGVLTLTLPKVEGAVEEKKIISIE